MGAFDDLITQPQARQPAVGAGGAFADLLPHANEPTRLQAFGYGAADAASLGFGDEGAGVLAGAGAVLSGQDYALAYRERVDAARQRLETARAVHPVSTMAGAVAGTLPAFFIPGAGQANAARTGATVARGVLPAAGRVLTGEALPFGRQLMTAAAGRGPGAVLAQGAQGVRQGALFGGVYGAGAANDGDRGAGFTQGALTGAALGGVTPFAFQGLTRGRMGENIAAATGNALVRGATGGAIGFGSSFFTGADPVQSTLWGAGLGASAKPIAMHTAGPLLAGVRRAWNNPREAFGGQTGMSIGIPPIGDDVAAAAGGASPPPTGAVRGIDRLIGRQRYGADELERRVASSQADPLDRTLADVGGEQFLAKADMLAQSPGRSGPIAANIAESRAASMSEQLTEGLRDGLGVRLSPTQAQRIIDDGLTLNGTGYENITGRVPVAGVVERRINPMMRDPLFQDALERLQRAEARRTMIAEADGLTPPAPSIVRDANGQFRLSENATGDTLHRLKMAFDDAVGAGKRRADPSSIEKFEAVDITQGPNSLRGRLLSALDDAMPGYTQARQTHGGLYEAQEALDAGRALMSRRPEEIADELARASPFERQHMQIAAADELIGRIMRSGSDDGGRMRNAANPIVNPEMKNRIRAIFDDADKAEEFVRRINNLDRLFRNSARWVGGADTYRRAMQAGDSAMGALADAGGDALTGNVGSAANNVRRGAWQALRGRVMEQQNDELGNALFMNVDRMSPDDRAYMQSLIAALRRLEADRASRAIGSGKDGTFGAVGGGSAIDEGY